MNRPEKKASEIYLDIYIVKFFRILGWIILGCFIIGWFWCPVFANTKIVKDTNNVYLFPLQEPMYTNSGKIICTSWYTRNRTEIIRGREVTYQYKALNYPADYGTNIIASGDGIVLDTLIDGYEGATVTIQYDNGLTMRICHLSKQLVLDGQRVKRGQVIAKVGRSGRTTGSHLRIVIEKNGERVFCNAETWGKKYTDFYYSVKTFNADDTVFYAKNN